MVLIIEGILLHWSKMLIGNYYNNKDSSIVFSYNLKVHIWTSRNENEFLLFDYGADVHEEFKDLIKAGVDGIFTDFTHSLFNFLSLQEDTCDA